MSGTKLIEQKYPKEGFTHRLLLRFITLGGGGGCKNAASDKINNCKKLGQCICE